jgi:hypothetical protein
MDVQLTGDARAVVLLAQDAARRLRHRWIGTEHLLFALAASQQPIGVLLREAGVEARPVWAGIVRLVDVGDRAIDWDALSAIGIDLDRVRAHVPAASGLATRSRTRRPRGHIRFNPIAGGCVRDAGAAGVVGSGSLGLAVVAGAGPATRAIMSDLGVSRSVVATRISDGRLG